MTLEQFRAEAESIVAAWYPAISPKLYREKLTVAIIAALEAAYAAGLKGHNDEQTLKGRR